MELAFVIANKYRSNVHGLHVRMDPRDIAPLAGEGLSGAMIEEMMESAEKEGMEHSTAARRMKVTPTSRGPALIGTRSSQRSSSMWPSTCIP